MSEASLNFEEARDRLAGRIREKFGLKKWGTSRQILKNVVKSGELCVLYELLIHPDLRSGESKNDVEAQLRDLEKQFLLEPLAVYCEKECFPGNCIYTFLQMIYAVNSCSG